jgi:hypothetical protein
MSRNGQYGQGRPPQRRGPADQDPYAPQWPQPGGYPDPNYANGGQQGYHYPPEPEPYGYAQNGGGLDRFAPAQNGAAPYQQDPRGYDLGSYMPNGAQGYPAQEPMQYAPPQQQGYAETDAEYDDGLDGEDESRGGRRWMVIAIALVGAIGLGGGLAYTYKMLFTNGSGRAPFVRNVEPPNKVKPVTGGRENAQVDKKLFTRLGEDSGGEVRGTPTGNEPDGQQADGSSDTQVGGPRPVRIIPIQPGGQGGPSTTGSVDSGARPGGGSQMVTVPGLMIDTGGAAARSRYPQQGAQQQAMQQQGSQQQGLQQQGPQQQGGQLGAPVRIAALPQQQSAQQGGAEPVLPPRRPVAIPTTPTTTPTTPTTSSTASAVQMAPKAPVPKKEAPAATTASNTPVSSGYVAVLSSKKSRMDAMKAYASLDQKYRDMLASSTFDVQEADLGDKGIWYRAVIGPPRSYEGAKKICDDLKAAGHQDCWPARY